MKLAKFNTDLRKSNADLRRYLRPSACNLRLSAFTIATALTIILLSLCASSFGEEVGRVISLEGRVDVFRANSETAMPIREDEFISVGDSLRTKSGSKIEVVFKDNSILRVAQNSKVTIKDYTFDEKNRRESAAIELSRGKARAIIEKMKDTAEFVITTPNAKGSVKGSDITAFYQAGNSGMFVTEGKLSVINIAHPETQIIVPAGNAALIPMGELPKGPRPYLDIEKKLNEEDTNVPKPVAKPTQISIIKGAVVKVSGAVSITNKGQAAAHEARVNDIVGEGDRIETGQNGYIEIRFDNNNALNLKPNTKLLILKLVINPSTGEYENIFEVTIGKIKARIEGLKGNSKFEVKTPTAICGARGTIMYTDVLPNITMSFFEGGNGYMTNNLTGDTKTIGAGEHASADDKGGISNPEPTSDSDRQSYGEGWDPSSGTEGYSKPEGDAGANMFDSAAGTGTDTGADTGEDTDTGNEGVFGNIPFTEAYYNPTTGPSAFPPLPEIFNFGSFETTNNDIIFTDDGSFWYGIQPAVANVSGQYINPNNFILWKGDVQTTVSGARLLGGIGGIKSGDYLEGLLYGIYIVSNGGIHETGYIILSDRDEAGNLITPLTGNFYPLLGEFQAAGNVITYQRGHTSISPEDLYYGSPYLDAGSFYGGVGGDLLGNIVGEHFSLSSKGENYDYYLEETNNTRPAYWGVWRSESSGTYTDLPSNNWKAVAGGAEDSENGTSYWFTNISGTNWSFGKLNGTVYGVTLNYDTLGSLHDNALGIISGDIIGNYGLGSWQALSAGTYIETPLTFGGETTHESGVDYALFGGTESLWGEDSPDILFVGNYSIQEAPSGSLWRFHALGRTDDDGAAGAIYGIAGGTNQNNIFKGLMYALYIRPDPESETGYSAGYIETTDIFGYIYPDIDMFSARGTVAAHSIGQTDVAPEFLYENIIQHNLSGLDDHGGFGTDDETDTDVYANQGSGTMLNIAGENWGIWNLVTGGTYQGPTSDTWDVYDLTGMTTTTDGDKVAGAWLGGIEGNPDNGKWSGGEIKGTLDAIWIVLDREGNLSGRKINGEVIGNYIEVNESVGTWNAASAGEWIEVDSLLSPENFTNDIIAVGQAANIPITEAYQSLMTMTVASPGITSMTMDTHLYNMVGGGDGIWAAIISGYYSQAPTSDWTVTVANGADNTTLSGSAWSNGQWAANVSGTVGGNSITGQAAGTYGDGAFSGAATGTYERPNQSYSITEKEKEKQDAG